MKHYKSNFWFCFSANEKCKAHGDSEKQVDTTDKVDVDNDVKDQTTDDSDAVKKSEQNEDRATKFSSEYLRTYLTRSCTVSVGLFVQIVSTVPHTYQHIYVCDFCLQPMGSQLP